MSIAKLVEGRRSVRKYKPGPVSAAMMTDLLQQAATLCPQPERLAATRFLLIQEEQERQLFIRAMINAFAASKLGKWIPQALQESAFKRYMQIPGHLVVMTKGDVNQRIQNEYTAEACYLLQSLQLLAWEQGIGMLWDSDETLYVSEFLDSLHMNEDERLLGVLHFGYAEKAPRPRKRTAAIKRWREYPHVGQ